MSFTWADAADVLESRSRRLGLDDDIAALLLAAWSVLSQIVETYDLPAYTIHNDAMFTTQEQVREYPLPENFGRLMHVRKELGQGIGGTGMSGIFLNVPPDGRPRPLRYAEPVDFRMQRRTTPGIPYCFTLAGRLLLLDPAPDAQTETGSYGGEGVYIAKVERPDLDLQEYILLDEPQTLVTCTLYQVTADKGLPQAQLLQTEWKMAMSALANNAARLHQQFFSMRWPTRLLR